MPAPCLFFSCRPCPALLLSPPTCPVLLPALGFGVGVARLRCSPPLAARPLSFRHWPASGGAFELLSASPACMSSSVLLWRPGERRARQRLVCWAPMPHPAPAAGRVRLAERVGAVQSESTTARSRGRWEACTSPVSPRESREKPGPPTAPSTLFPWVESERAARPSRRTSAARG